jgi:hypothetical protein
MKSRAERAVLLGTIGAKGCRYKSLSLAPRAPQSRWQRFTGLTPPFGGSYLTTYRREAGFSPSSLIRIGALDGC